METAAHPASLRCVFAAKSKTKERTGDSIAFTCPGTRTGERQRRRCTDQQEQNE